MLCEVERCWQVSGGKNTRLSVSESLSSVVLLLTAKSNICSGVGVVVVVVVE